VASVLLRDDPWTRLPFLVPLALVASVLSLMGFVRLLTPPPPKPAPAALSVELIELPAPPAQTAPEPPPLQEVAPEPPPPEPAVEPPPEPMPEPQPAVEPAKAAPEPPPPAKPPAPRRQAPPKAAQQPPAAAAQPAPPVAPSPASAAPASSGLTGARAIFKPMPEVPEALRRRNLELVAMARFQVAANGSAKVELIEPTSDPELNRSLLETLQKWRFFPAMEQGKAVASVIDIRIPVSVR
jgi:periplasmic protein TonB